MIYAVKNKDYDISSRGEITSKPIRNSQKPLNTLCSLKCSYRRKSYLWKFGNDACVNTNKSNVWCRMNETSENCLFNTASLRAEVRQRFSHSPSDHATDTQVSSKKE